MKRLAEPLAGLTGREAAFPNASPEAGSGEFKMESGDRSGFPVGPLPRNSERVLCAFARSGFPVRVRYRFLPSVAPIRKNRRNASDLAYGPRSRSGGSASFGSPWWASSGRPPRFRLPRGSPQAIRFLAGFSSAFNRPSLGRPAGRLKALPLVGINVSRLLVSGFWGYPSTPLTALTGLTGPHINRSVSLFYPVRGCEGFPLSTPHSPHSFHPVRAVRGVSPVSAVRGVRGG